MTKENILELCQNENVLKPTRATSSEAALGYNLYPNPPAPNCYGTKVSVPSSSATS